MQVLRTCNEIIRLFIMKYILSLLATVLFTVVNAQQKMRLTCDAKETGDTVIVQTVDYKRNEFARCDTAITKDGQFSLDIPLEKAADAIICNIKNGGMLRIRLYLVPGEHLHISGAWPWKQLGGTSLTIGGSAFYEQLHNFNNAINPIMEEVNPMREKIQEMNKAGVSKDSITAYYNKTLTNIYAKLHQKRMEIIRTAPRNSSEFQEALDKLKQPFSAKIAIHEGGLIGKGPGRSTQRYVVPIMFEDYMFSFIVEEYGLLGGMLVIILYISLLARGSIIVRNCDNHFAKTAVAGLVILITGQAMMHIMINCDLGPLTGQTLPLVSHGNSSFLMFSVAFGIILSISKMARRKIAREAEKAAPLVEHESDNEVSSRLNDLEVLESELPIHDNDIPDYGIDDHNNE